VGVIKKPESQQYQGLASPNKAITPTTPCKVGISQILCKALHFYFAINIQSWFIAPIQTIFNNIL
jgi:hypothetical protein